MKSKKNNRKNLSEICKIFSGGTPSTKNNEYWNGDIPWLSSGETRNSFITNTERKITLDGVKNSSTSLAKKYDVIVASAGQGHTRGQVSLCLIDTYVNQSVIVLRTNKEIILPQFLFYNLKSRYAELRQLSDSHSSRGSLPKNVLSTLDIVLPSLLQQEKIGKILYDLDSKIQNLKNQNKILEQTAQIIFKSWFVNFDGITEFEDSKFGKTPKGWRVGTFSEIIDEIESGKRPKGGINHLDSEVPSIGAENIIGLGKYNYSKTKFISLEFFNKMNTGKIKENDVLLYKDGASLGRSSLFRNGFPFEKCCINEHVFILRPSKKISTSFLFFWIDQDFMKQEIKNLNSNSAQPGINQPSVLSLPILIPEINVNKQFEILVEPILKKFFKNILISNQLSKIQDALLPKLMGGEIQL